MAELITLTEDCELGPAGMQVWVDDPKLVQDKPKPRKASAKSKSDDK